MPISGINWDDNAERDRHLLPGERLALGDVLGFIVSPTVRESPAAYMATHSDVILTYRPLFSGTMQGDELRNFGVNVNVNTGAIRIDPAPLPVPTKANFIIEVEARNAASLTPFRQQIRIHVHRQVVDLWLTPTPRLTVRPLGAVLPELTPFHFSARAQFDDGVVGDITQHHGVVWTSTPAGAVNAEGRLIIPAGFTPGQEVDITATFGGRSASAKMKMERAWADEPNKPKAILSAGGALPFTRALDDALNVLIIGDAFPDAAPFDRQVHTLVHYLHRNVITRPFDLLASSINFWRLRMPVATTGVSVRCEVYQTVGDPTRVNRVPLPARPPPVAPWSIEHAVYAVGLPLRGDEALGVSAIRARWSTQTDVDPNPFIADAVVDRWKGLALRGLADDEDSLFPGLAFGVVPDASSGGAGYDLDRRSLDEVAGHLSVRRLRAFIGAIEANNGTTLPNGDPLGRVWTRVPQPSQLDSRGAVLIVPSLPFASAVNRPLEGGRLIVFHGELGADVRVKTPVAGRHAFTMLPRTIDHVITPMISRIVAHELGHSLGLGDEYATAGTTFADSAASIAEFGNLQADSELRTTPGGPLDGGRIKWLWHRISKAAVLRVSPRPSALGFELQVRSGEARAFAKEDIVRVRLRVPGAAQRGLQPTTRDLKVAADPTTDSLMVAAASGPALSPADFALFGGGSIVYAPVPNPGNASQHAELVAASIKNLITTHNAPLTAAVCELVASTAAQAPNLRGASIGVCRKQIQRIVGLYAGGKLHACGIYHPTGYCMMRDPEDLKRPYCHVCRYIMVDLLNPVKHADIDRDYASTYPH